MCPGGGGLPEKTQWHTGRFQLKPQIRKPPRSLHTTTAPREEEYEVEEGEEEKDEEEEEVDEEKYTHVCVFFLLC